MASPPAKRRFTNDEWAMQPIFVLDTFKVRVVNRSSTGNGNTRNSARRHACFCFRAVELFEMILYRVVFNTHRSQSSFARNRTVAVGEFQTNFDKENWSIWYGDYKYPQVR